MASCHLADYFGIVEAWGAAEEVEQKYFRAGSRNGRLVEKSGNAEMLLWLFLLKLSYFHVLVDAVSCD